MDLSGLEWTGVDWSGLEHGFELIRRRCDRASSTATAMILIVLHYEVGDI